MMKNIVHYVRYVLLIGEADMRWLVGDLVALLLSAVGMIAQPGQPLWLYIGALAMAWGIFAIARGCWKLLSIREAKAIKLATIPVHGKTVPMNRIRPESSMESLGFVVQPVTKSESIIRSATLDTWIRANDVRLAWSSIAARRVRDHIKDKREVLLPFLGRQFVASLAESNQFFNDSKICLGSDILPGCTEVSVYEAGYFDSFLTNEVCTTQLMVPSGDTLVDGTHFFPAYLDWAGVPRLKQIADSLMNNHIGVSVLAITTDGELLIWQQSERAVIHPGQLVASGSGSCDASDAREESLVKTVVTAMERELREESVALEHPIRETEIGPTMLLGYWRWVRRGGKPEFAGVTRLKVPRTMIEPNTTEVRRPTEHRPSRWPAKNTGQLLRSIVEIRSQRDLSVSLAACLLALEEYATSNPQEVDAFLL